MAGRMPATLTPSTQGNAEPSRMGTCTLTQFWCAHMDPESECPRQCRAGQNWDLRMRPQQCPARTQQPQQQLIVQRKDMITKHRFTLHLITDSTAFNSLSSSSLSRPTLTMFREIRRASMGAKRAGKPTGCKHTHHSRHGAPLCKETHLLSGAYCCVFLIKCLRCER